MTFILLSLLSAGFIVELIQKYIFRKKDPSVEDFWTELDEQGWYQELIQDHLIKDFMLQSKKTGLLKDPHYVRNVIDKEGHREGFIQYVMEKTNKVV